MAEEFQTLEIPLVGGVNQKADPRHLKQGLLTANNIRKARDGSYVKRSGFTKVTAGALGSGAALSLTGISTREQELFGHTYGGGSGTSIYSYSAAAATQNANAAWSYRSGAPVVTADITRVAEFGAYSPDIAVATGTKTLCYVGASQNSSVFATIADENLQSVIVGPTTLTTSSLASRPRVVAVGNTFVCAYRFGGTVVAQTFNSAALSGSWSGETTLRSNITTAGTYYNSLDLAAGSDRFFLSYQSTATNAVQVVSFWPNLTEIATVELNTGTTTNVASTGLFVQGNTGNSSVTLSVAKYSFAGAYIETWVSALTYNVAHVATTLAGLYPVEVGSDSGIWSTSVYTEGNTSRVITSIGAIEAAGLSGNLYVNSVQYLALNAESGSIVLNTNVPNLVAKSKITAIRGKYCFLGTTSRGYDSPRARWAEDSGSDKVPVDFLVSMPATNSAISVPEAIVYPRLAAYPCTTNNSAEGSACSIVRDSAGRYVTIGSYNVNLSQQKVGAYVSRFTSTPADMQGVTFGGVAFLSSGVAGAYDGRGYTENGFVTEPKVRNSEAFTSIFGNMTPSSSYRYAVTYSHVDAAGNLSRSAPYFWNQSTAATNNAVNLYITDLCYTYKSSNASNVDIEIWRTLANTSDTLYLVHQAGTANRPGQAYDVFSDVASDNAISTNQILYSVSGSLPNVIPPSCRIVTQHRGRLFLAGTPDSRQVWASKKYVPYEAPAFSDGLVFTVDEGGPVTALASMDDKLLVFKRGLIFYIAGDGPTDSGANYDWTDPVLIQCPVGSVTPYTAVTPRGVLFQSEAGISLIDRGLNVDPYFGASVTDYMAGKTISGALQVSGTTEVRMPLVGGGEVRYDYRTNEWYTANSTVITNVSSVTMWSNVYTALNYQANVYMENAATSADDGTFQPYTLELAPVSVAGTVGYQDIKKVSVLLEKNTNSLVTINVAVDGGSYTQGMTQNASNLTGEYVVAYTPTSQKGRSARIKITDAAAGSVGTGVGSNVIAVTIEGAVKQGAFPLVPSTQKG